MSEAEYRHGKYTWTALKIFWRKALAAERGEHDYVSGVVLRASSNERHCRFGA
jgi:hypothetical protein